MARVCGSVGGAERAAQCSKNVRIRIQEANEKLQRSVQELAHSEGAGLAAAMAAVKAQNAMKQTEEVLRLLCLLERDFAEYAAFIRSL